MAKRFSQSMETRDDLSTTCQDACQCLMLHPYITASRTSSQNCYAFSGKYPSI